MASATMFVGEMTTIYGAVCSKTTAVFDQQVWKNDTRVERK